MRATVQTTQRTRVCVVGLGPSAADKAEEIDACDFVVRLKGFWLHGAENAGSKISAHASYGDLPKEDYPELRCEHWFTHCPQHVRRQVIAWGAKRLGRLEFFAAKADGCPIRILPTRLWQKLRAYLNRDPSTGIVAVAMALERFPECELVLHGFDSTVPERPNFWDARQAESTKFACHAILAEKQALAEIDEGRWLGEPTHATLTWPARPDIAAAVEYVRQTAEEAKVKEAED